MSREVIRDYNFKNIGICTICSTLHLDYDGFDENRKCIECGEHSVFSITELLDITNDYKQLKHDFYLLDNL